MVRELERLAREQDTISRTILGYETKCLQMCIGCYRLVEIFPDEETRNFVGLLCFGVFRIASLYI